MRTRRTMRAPRAAQLAVGALLLALPSSAYALTSGPAVSTPAQHHHPFVLRAWPQHRQLAYGRDAVVSGTTTSALGRAPVGLQYLPAGSSRWRMLETGRARPNGRFTLRAPIRQSGLVRVVETALATGVARSDIAALAGAGPVAASRPARIEVAAVIRVASHRIGGLVGRSASLSGRLLPAAGGRIVRLLAGSGAKWTTVARARTGRAGGFHLRFPLPSDGDRALRVSFAGDRENRPAETRAGDAIGFTESVASWYDDAGSTACGFHATLGVANKTLPCGTHVTLSYGSRTIVATVDDRGPFVPGRDYDLNQNTAAALGMYGVATVLSSV